MISVTGATGNAGEAVARARHAPASACVRWFGADRIPGSSCRRHGCGRGGPRGRCRSVVLVAYMLLPGVGSVLARRDGASVLGAVKDPLKADLVRRRHMLPSLNRVRTESVPVAEVRLTGQDARPVAVTSAAGAVEGIGRPAHRLMLVGCLVRPVGVVLDHPGHRPRRAHDRRAGRVLSRADRSRPAGWRGAGRNKPAATAWPCRPHCVLFGPGEHAFGEETLP
jgi:hypothetical protein